MISEIDINDWESLTEPIEVEKLQALEIFSFPNDEQQHLFQMLGVNFNNEVACRMLDANDRCFIFPKFLKVFKWQQKLN